MSIIIARYTWKKGRPNVPAFLGVNTETGKVLHAVLGMSDGFKSQWVVQHDSTALQMGFTFVGSSQQVEIMVNKALKDESSIKPFCIHANGNYCIKCLTESEM